MIRIKKPIKDIVYCNYYRAMFNTQYRDQTQPYFLRFEVINIKTGITFESLDEVYQYYNDNVLKIVNIKQLLFYSDIMGVQPDWIGKSAYNEKLIAYYGKERTKECWERWKRYDT